MPREFVLVLPVAPPPREKYAAVVATARAGVDRAQNNARLATQFDAFESAGAGRGDRNGVATASGESIGAGRTVGGGGRGLGGTLMLKSWGRRACSVTWSGSQI